MATQKRFVIIGTGAAGSHCAMKLRELNPAASITMISRGPFHCYHKYALTDYLIGKIKKEALFNKRITTYIEENITVRLSQAVT